MRRFTAWGLVIVVLALVGLSLGALTPAEAAPPAAPPLQGAGESPCVPDHSKIASPKVILLGETVDITLTVRAVCAGERFPLHIVLVLDGSGSMAGTPNQQLKQAAASLIRGLDMDQYPATKAGVVEFNSVARTLSPLTNVENRVVGAVNRVGANGGTRIDAGILEGMRVLRQGRGDEKDITEVMVVLSDGGNNAGCQPVLQAAGQARGQGILMISICVGSGCDEQCMRQVASSPRYYFRAENAGALQGVFQTIRDRILNINLKKLVVKDTLPSFMEFVKQSANPEQSSPDDPSQWLQWDDVYIPKEGTTYTFKVRPLKTGYLPTNELATGQLTDNKGRTKEWEFEIPYVTVLQPRQLVTPETPPPTVTITPSPTPTITPSPTVTPSPTITVTPSPTPTERPKPIYLPILLREKCVVDYVYADVALVLDMSTSMRMQAPGSPTKLAAVIASAHGFVNLLDMTPDEHGRRAQAAVAGFNSQAWIQQGMTANTGLVHRAIDDLAKGMREGTRLDLAFDIGAEAVNGPGRDPWNQRVIVMLTDGLPNKIPPAADGTMETAVIEAADRAKDQSERVYTIGVGYDDPTKPLTWQINTALLRATADTPDDFFQSPTGTDLEHIYREIWKLLDPCSGRHDWGRPWPPPSSQLR